MQQKIINRENTSSNYTLASPIGGLNVRDSLDTMNSYDAIVMDNYIPTETKVALRKGYRSYAALKTKTTAILLP